MKMMITIMIIADIRESLSSRLDDKIFTFFYAMSMVAVSCESQGAGCWGIVHNGRWFNIIFMNRDNVSDPLSPAHERLEHFERWEHIIIWNYFKWKSRFHYEQVSSTSMCFSALFKLFETIRREEWASEYRRMKGKTEEIKRKKNLDKPDDRQESI